MNPYLEKDTLVIPSDCEKKYKWWAGGQSVIETLKELEAGPEIMAKYRDKYNGGG